jgi:hypothetical protein
LSNETDKLRLHAQVKGWVVELQEMRDLIFAPASARLRRGGHANSADGLILNDITK